MSQADPFRSWYQEVLEIKRLFSARKYKHCATRCDEFLTTAQDPIHRAFLYFYQALCYESLGAASHIYSDNKLPALRSAKVYFGLALGCLTPLQQQQQQHKIKSVDDNDGGDNDGRDMEGPPHGSLYYPASDIIAAYATPLRKDGDGGVDTAVKSDVVDSPATTTSNVSVYSPGYGGDVPDFEAYTPRQDPYILPRATVLQERKNERTPVRVSKTGSNHHHHHHHKARLSESLSSTHVLSDELVPSPLFNKISHGKALSSTICSGHLPSESDTEVTLAINTPTPLHPRRERPLPPLPFNHKPRFAKKGDRLILIPSNKPETDHEHRARVVPGQTQRQTVARPRKSSTTIQLLAAKFETAHLSPVTPITPRFRRISQIFSVRNDDNNQSKGESQSETNLRNENHSHDQDTYTPAPSNPFESFNTSFHTTLTSFTQSLTEHISTLTSQIQSTETVQETHRIERKDKRVASFWSFDVDPALALPTTLPSTPSTPTSKDTNARARTRVFNSNSVEKYATRARDVTRRRRPGTGERRDEDRIVKLKQRGWTVRKEDVGFRGTGYYDRLTEDVERELGLL